MTETTSRREAADLVIRWTVKPALKPITQDSECTHDHCHPNDYGTMQMSKVYAEAVSSILKK